MNTPIHPNEISPSWLTFALREAGLINNSSVVGVDKTILGSDKGFKSSVVRVGIKYDHSEAGAPSSVVVKIQPENENMIKENENLHSFAREIYFYREIAPSAPIRLPNLYYAIEEPPAYCMVMEDLSSLTLGDQTVGMHQDLVIATLNTIAKLQAKYWNNELLNGLGWMPTLEDMFSHYEEDKFLENCFSFLEHFGFKIGIRGLALGYKLKDNADWLKNEILSRQKTIVHFDLREDNLVFGKPGTDEEVLILDWQLAIRSMGAMDVARLIGGSEIPADRKGHQLAVLRCWHDTLIEEGVINYSWDEAVYDLKLGALAYIGVTIQYHKDFITDSPRIRKLGKVMIGGLFSSAVEIDAGSILPK